MADYYQTLGVDKTASDDEIKRAYRKLASKNHPDKGGNTEKFQEIQEAYATLSDNEKRHIYDNPPPQGVPNGQGFHFNGVPPGMEDFFAQAFGGFNNSPFGGMFRQQQPRNKVLNLNTSITLKESFTGKDLLASVKLPNGRDQTIEVKIPAGIQDGTTLRLAGLGDDTYSDLPRGDIHLTVSVQPHTRFKREGDDLVHEINVSCIDAMLGSSVFIDTIDDKTLEIKINPGTQPGQIYAAQGYGMPNMHDNRFKGRMLIPVNITIPLIDEDQRKQLNKIFK